MTTLDKPLGSGGSGTVYSLENDPLHVVKRIAHSEEILPTMEALREMSAIRCVPSHPHIMPLTSFKVSPNYTYLHFPRAKEDLSHHLSTYRLSWTQKIKVMIQILYALEHIHRHHIIHRDVTSRNILIDQAGTIRLSDFGSSRMFTHQEDNFTPIITCLWYRSPEALFRTGYHTAAMDMWSFGIVCLHILSGDPVLQARTELDMITECMQVFGTPTKEEWKGMRVQSPPIMNHNDHPKLNDIIWKMKIPEDKKPIVLNLIQSVCTYHPQERLSASEALKHPLFSAISIPVPSPSLTLPLSLPPSPYRISKDMRDARRQTIDWMIDITSDYDFPHSVILLSISIIDRTPLTDIQLRAAVALWMSSYVLCESVFTWPILCAAMDYQCSFQSFSNMVRKTLRELNGCIFPPHWTQPQLNDPTTPQERLWYDVCLIHEVSLSYTTGEQNKAIVDQRGPLFDTWHRWLTNEIQRNDPKRFEGIKRLHRDVLKF
jgi:serine/threonine protein kinase